MKYSTYPEHIPDDSDFPLYFIEFNDWENGKPVHWKLCKRSFLMNAEDAKRIQETATASASEKFHALMSREGHPWSILEDEVLPDGCTPNKEWLCWMVDALNEKCIKK